ncbi:MAG: oligogalacturonate lyase family protein [Verrucomicrobiia bacterium]|jgi:oligogalacturonide lyase
MKYKLSIPTALLLALTWADLSVLAAESFTNAPPTEWIERKTGHRVIRLSPDTGGSSLYFHQHSYTPEGDKIIIDAGDGIATVDLTTLGVSRPKVEIVAPGARALATAWRKRDVYFRRGNSLFAVNLDTKAEREVVKFPPQMRRGGGLAVNADETLVVGIGPDPDGKAIPRTPPPGREMGGRLDQTWAAGGAKMIYTINVKTGEFKVIHRENDWTNHLQCSPTDPMQILFCHEGPWHWNDRTWTIRADGTGLRLLHERTMNMEIEGHEFFGADGKTVWYDLQTPRSTVFWLAGVNLETGKRTWYNLQRNEWSVHYNVSPDGKLFAGDGGGPASIAARSPDGQILDPPGNGQWIYLFHPVMVAGNSGPIMADGKPLTNAKNLIQIGYFKSERLADLSSHDYSLEPNVTFTPDGKWIVFQSNMHGPTHVYAVEVEKSGDKN